MGIRAINWATRQRVGNATAKHALLWLAFHANEKSGECFPSVELLMEEMEVGSKNTVKAALKTLIDAGLIYSKREMKGNRVSRTFYFLNVHGSISDPSTIDGSNIDGSNIDADGSNFDGHGSISDRLMGQPLTPNKELTRKRTRKLCARLPALHNLRKCLTTKSPICSIPYRREKGHPFPKKGHPFLQLRSTGLPRRAKSPLPDARLGLMPQSRPNTSKLRKRPVSGTLSRSSPHSSITQSHTIEA